MSMAIISLIKTAGDTLSNVATGVITSNTDQKIAKTQAAANVQMAQINADTLAKMNAQTLAASQANNTGTQSKEGSKVNIVAVIVVIAIAGFIWHKFLR
ncbi:MAG: hypothetical protein M0R02_09365 [Bacteroidales bacterium]|nr:hypothetical protein [Bacteroidales bacterium]